MQKDDYGSLHKAMVYIALTQRRTIGASTKPIRHIVTSTISALQSMAMYGQPPTMACLNMTSKSTASV